MRNSRTLLWLLPLLLLLTAPLWRPAVADFLRPRGGYDDTVAAAYRKKDQKFVMDAITITLSSNGRLEWVIRAERAFTGDSDREIGMQEVDAVYTSADREETRISSNRGTYFLDERHLVLKENVVIRKPAAGEAIYTDLLHYYDANKMVVSPVPVDIKGPNFSIQAGRMDYDLTTDGYDLGNRVKVDF